MILTLFLMLACATAQNSTAAVVGCDKTLAAEMGTGGAGLMFFLGFMVAAVLALLGWFFLIRKPAPHATAEAPSIPVTIQPPVYQQPPPQQPVYQQPTPQQPVYQQPPPPQPVYQQPPPPQPVYPTPPPGPQGARIYWPNKPQQQCYYYSPVPNKLLY